MDTDTAQFEEAVTVHCEPISGEAPAELTVIVDRNLAGWYDDKAMNLGTAVER